MSSTDGPDIPPPDPSDPDLPRNARPGDAAAPAAGAPLHRRIHAWWTAFAAWWQSHIQAALTENLVRLMVLVIGGLFINHVYQGYVSHREDVRTLRSDVRSDFETRRGELSALISDRQYVLRRLMYALGQADIAAFDTIYDDSYQPHIERYNKSIDKYRKFFAHYAAETRIDVKVHPAPLPSALLLDYRVGTVGSCGDVLDALEPLSLDHVKLVHTVFVPEGGASGGGTMSRLRRDDPYDGATLFDQPPLSINAHLNNINEYLIKIRTSQWRVCAAFYQKWRDDAVDLCRTASLKQTVADIGDYHASGFGACAREAEAHYRTFLGRACGTLPGRELRCAIRAEYDNVGVLWEAENAALSLDPHIRKMDPNAFTVWDAMFGTPPNIDAIDPRLTAATDEAEGRW